MAGPGHLELEVSGGNGALVASSVRPLGGHRYAAAFTPRLPRPHTVRVTFNDEHVPGGSLFSLSVLGNNRGQLRCVLFIFSHFLQSFELILICV